MAFTPKIIRQCSNVSVFPNTVPVGFDMVFLKICCCIFLVCTNICHKTFIFTEPKSLKSVPICHEIQEAQFAVLRASKTLRLLFSSASPSQEDIQAACKGCQLLHLLSKQVSEPTTAR